MTDNLTPRLRNGMINELNAVQDLRNGAAARIEALEAELASYRENFPCDGGCNPNDGPAEECSLHGRGPSDLWQIIGRVMAERDARDAVIAEALKAVRRYRRTDQAWVLIDQLDILLSRVPQGAADDADVDGDPGWQGAAEPSDDYHSTPTVADEGVLTTEPWTDPKPWIDYVSRDRRSERPTGPDAGHYGKDPRSREQYDAEEGAK